jgi:hypothetical protein
VEEEAIQVKDESQMQQRDNSQIQLNMQGEEHAEGDKSENSQLKRIANENFWEELRDLLASDYTPKNRSSKDKLTYCKYYVIVTPA